MKRRPSLRYRRYCRGSLMPSQMKPAYSELGSLVAALSQALAAEPHQLLPCFSHESPPEELQLLWQPPLPYAGAGSASLRQIPNAPGQSAPAPPALGHDAPGRDVRSALLERKGAAANFRCELCPERLYAVDRYYRKGRRPLLLLVYNGPYGRSRIRKELSRHYRLGGAEQDRIFGRILACLGLQLDDLHWQELPACHFNANRSLWDDWHRRAQNCLLHVRNSIEENGIERVILCGATALFLLGEQEAISSVERGRPFELKIEAKSWPAIAIRSPEALLALETRRQQLQRKRLEQTAEQTPEQALKQALDQERRIKQGVLRSLQQFLGDYLGDHIEKPS